MKIKFQLFYIYNNDYNNNNNNNNNDNTKKKDGSNSSDEHKLMKDMIDKYRMDKGSIDEMLHSFPLGFNVNGEPTISAVYMMYDVDDNDDDHDDHDDHDDNDDNFDDDDDDDDVDDDEIYYDILYSTYVSYD